MNNISADNIKALIIYPLFLLSASLENTAYGPMSRFSTS